MGLFTGYAGWIAGVRDYIGSDEYTDAQIEVFLYLAQKQLNRELKSVWMEKSMALTITDPTYGAALDLLVNITDFGKIRLVNVDSSPPLDASAINELITLMDEDTSPVTSTDDPQTYCIDAGLLYVYPWPAVDAVVNVRYYEEVIPISLTLASNTFTDYHEDVLLYAACLAAAVYQVEDERIPIWKSEYERIKEEINNSSGKIKLGSTPLKRQITGLS